MLRSESQIAKIFFSLSLFSFNRIIKTPPLTNSCLISSSVVVQLPSVSSRDPMDCSTPGLPVTHHLLEFAQVPAMHQWCHPTISSSVVLVSFWLQSIPASGSFSRSQLFASGGQSVGAAFPVPSVKWFVQGYECIKSVAALSVFLSKVLFICLPWLRALPWFFFFSMKGRHNILPLLKIFT